MNQVQFDGFHSFKGACEVNFQEVIAWHVLDFSIHGQFILIVCTLNKDNLSVAFHLQFAFVSEHLQTSNNLGGGKFGIEYNSVSRLCSIR